jgi:AraC-like DNA-binding protein
MTAFHIATSVHSVGRYMMDHGAPPCELLRDLHLPTDLLFDHQSWVPRDSVLSLGETLKERMSDPLALLHVLERFSLHEYGDWYARLTEKPDLNQTLRHLCLSIGMIETGTRLTTHTGKNECRLRAELVGDLAYSPSSFLEGLLFNLVRLLNMAGDTFPVQICLPHAAHHVAAMEEIFNHPIRFNSDYAEIAFDHEALTLPLARMQSTITPVSAQPEFTCREVNRLIQSTIDFDRPTAQQVAQDLSINLRSMQRHLAAWGVTFEEMLDIYRQRRAVQYLNDNTYTITDIAQHLGYSDAAHFSRAFRRWYGMPPAAFRKQHPQADKTTLLSGNARAAKNIAYMEKIRLPTTFCSSHSQVEWTQR